MPGRLQDVARQTSRTRGIDAAFTAPTTRAPTRASARVASSPTSGHAAGSLTGSHAAGSLTGSHAAGSLTGSHAAGSLTGSAPSRTIARVGAVSGGYGIPAAR